MPNWRSTQISEGDRDNGEVVWRVWVDNGRGQTEVIEIDEVEVHDSMFDSIVRCTGPCECSIEPDGVCHNGWPSILMVLGVI